MRNPHPTTSTLNSRQEEEEGNGEVDGLRVANEELQALLDQTLDTAALKVSSLHLFLAPHSIH